MTPCNNCNHFAILKSLLIIGVISCWITACSTPGKGLFAGKTAHERYADKISNAGLKQTFLGQAWFEAAGKGLNKPLTIQLPYKETGYFDASKPDAAGYRFAARRGDKILVQLNRKPATSFTLFLDLWQPVPNEQPRLLAAADTNSTTLTYEISKDGDYLLRLQPELLAGGEYSLIVRTGPSLDFPVAVKARPRISSFWGDARDAGARSHEGIDIFGAFRTPLLAAADGNITSVTTNKLGGKVVFLHPDNKTYVLYYAHLDSQLVESGQRVKVGDTIGLMGNTGNARTTPPHLHFGIYATGGAIDPLPFVDTKRAEPADITAAAEHVNALVRSEKNAVVYTAPDKQATKVLTPATGTLLHVQSVTGAWYKVQMPDGQEGFIAGSVVQPASTPLRTWKSDSTQSLLDKPDILAASRGTISKAQTVTVLGSFNNFYYVSTNDKQGWVLK
jgi:murein DD-endopeptidase MepM/ murein hydrolase activator NlpD